MNIKTLALVCTTTFALYGCGNINQENYDKLEVGMDYKEVTDVIGKPDNCSETLGTKRCTWGNEDKYIKVSFIADKATLYSNKGLSK